MKTKIKYLLIGAVLASIASFSTSAFADQLISLLIVDYKILVNGQDLKSDLPVLNYNGNTYIPLRKVSEATGAKVEWNGDKKQVNITASVYGDNKPLSATSINDAEMKIIKTDKGVYTGRTNGDQRNGFGIQISYQDDGKIVNSSGLWVNDNLVDGSISGSDKESIYASNLNLSGRVSLLKFLSDNSFWVYDVDKNGDGYIYTFDKNIGMTCYESKNNVKGTIYSNFSKQATLQNSNSKESDSSVIESKIDGEFEGWKGDTVFKLQNGQIWKQSSFGYKYVYRFSPKVLIYKNSDGDYKMKVDDVDGEITVTQIK